MEIEPIEDQTIPQRQAIRQTMPFPQTIPQRQTIRQTMPFQIVPRQTIQQQTMPRLNPAPNSYKIPYDSYVYGVVNIMPTIPQNCSFENYIHQLLYMFINLPDVFYNTFNNYEEYINYPFFEYSIMYSTMIHNNGLNIDLACTKPVLFAFTIHNDNNYYIDKIIPNDMVWNSENIKNSFNDRWFAIQCAEFIINDCYKEQIKHQRNIQIFYKIKFLTLCHIYIYGTPIITPIGFPIKYLLSRNKWTCVSSNCYVTLLINVVEMIKNIFITRQENQFFNRLKENLLYLYNRFNNIKHKYMIAALYHLIYGSTNLAALFIHTVAIMEGKDTLAQDPNYNFNDLRLKYYDGIDDNGIISNKPLSIKSIELLQNDNFANLFKHFINNGGVIHNVFDIVDILRTEPNITSHNYFDCDCGGFESNEDWMHSSRDNIVEFMTRFYTLIINTILFMNPLDINYMPLVFCNFNDTIPNSKIYCISYNAECDDEEHYFHFNSLNFIINNNICLVLQRDDNEVSESRISTGQKVFVITEDNGINDVNLTKEKIKNELEKFDMSEKPQYSIYVAEYLYQPRYDLNTIIDDIINLINDNKIIRANLYINIKYFEKTNQPIETRRLQNYYNINFYNNSCLLKHPHMNGGNGVIEFLNKYLIMIMILIIIVVIIVIVIIVCKKCKDKVKIK